MHFVPCRLGCNMNARHRSLRAGLGSPLLAQRLRQESRRVLARATLDLWAIRPHRGRRVRPWSTVPRLRLAVRPPLDIQGRRQAIRLQAVVLRRATPRAAEDSLAEVAEAAPLMAEAVGAVVVVVDRTDKNHPLECRFPKTISAVNVWP